MVAKVKFTSLNARAERRDVNRVTAPMRAVLKQVTFNTSTDDETTGLQVEFPFGPVDVRYANLAPRYSQIARPGLHPLLVRTAPQLNTVTFTALIADKRTGGKESVEDTLEILTQMATEDVDCEFIYGLSALPYRVRITQMGINSRYRNFEGQLTQANVSIQLTEAPEFNPLLGELTAVTPVGTLGTAPNPDGVVTAGEADSPEDPKPSGYTHIIVRVDEVP